MSTPAHAVCSNNEDGQPGQDGEMEYFTATDTLMYCDDTNWIDMTELNTTMGCPTGITSCGGRDDERVVFVSSTTSVAGSYGSLTAADTICQSDATTAGLNGTYYAWLADSTASNEPAACFEQFSGDYVMVDGTVIANGWTDLTDGTIDNNIDLEPDNTSDGTNAISSNVASDGTQKGSAGTDHCSDYSSTATTLNRGLKTSATSTWTDNSTGDSCNVATHLYCFEQVEENIGLVGHWKLDETAGTTAVDSTINGNDGTMVSGLSGTDSSAGQVNTSLQFDGTDDGINVGSPTAVDEIFKTGGTVAAWVYFDSLLAGGMRIFDKNQGGTGNTGWLTSVFSTGELSFNRVFSGGSGVWQTSSPVFSSGQWYHVAITYDDSSTANNPIIYINGSSVAITETNTPSGTAVADTTDLLFIGNRNSGNSPVDGRMDDARAYKRILTGAEITALYDLGNPDGLVGHWKLDETAGTTAVDDSSSGNDGTYVDGVTPAADSVAGRIGTSIDFSNGSTNSNNRVTAANIPAYDSLSALTLSAWVRPYRFGGHMGIIELTDFAQIRLEFSSTRISFHTDAWSGGRTNWRTSDTGMAVNKWTHLAVTYDHNSTANNPVIYMNGLPVAQTVVGTPSGTFTNPGTSVVNIGRGVWNGSFTNFLGSVDDARIYSRELSADEIYILAYCSRPGVQYYNSNTDAMQWCNDVNSPINMGLPAGGVGGCAAPVPTEGALAYDTDRYKYCDGNGVIDVGK